MWLFPIYAFVVYGSAVAVLGLILLEFLPGFSLSGGNLGFFVLGGLLGMITFVRLVSWGLHHLPYPWRMQRQETGQILLYFLMATGAALGGTSSVWLKLRVRRKREQTHRP